MSDKTTGLLLDQLGEFLTRQPAALPIDQRASLLPKPGNLSPRLPIARQELAPRAQQPDRYPLAYLTLLPTGNHTGRGTARGQGANIQRCLAEASVNQPVTRDLVPE